MNYSQIIAKLKKLEPSLQRQYQVKSLGLFGSYVRGEQKSKSDLDLLVEFSKTPSLFAFIRLENKLSEIFGVKVDLVMKTSLKPAIGKHILQEAVAI